MSSAAKAFVETLAKKDRKRGVFEFEDRERFDWHYTPRRRQGIAIGDMNETQRATAHALLGTGLSEAGYEKAVQTMRLEAVLKEIETFGFNRDPENYALTVFGDPTAFPWGWRFEGHHLSLNFSVIAPAQVTITPAFIGSNPATVPVGESRGLRTMALEEDLGRL